MSPSPLGISLLEWKERPLEDYIKPVKLESKTDDVPFSPCPLF